MRASKPRVSAMVAAFVSLALATACKDNGTGPSGSFDPDLVSAALGGVSDALLDNDASVSLAILAPYIAGIAGQATATASQPSAARIPSSALGATFVWDPEQFGYVQDESRTGAPSDGARFILYKVNQTTQSPSTPLEEIGYLDVRDFSSGTSVDIRHTAVIGGVTELSFDVTGTLTETGYDLTADGTFSDGTTDGDFTYAAEASADGISLSIDAAAAPYTLNWEYVRSGAFAEGPGSDRITLQDTQTGNKIEFVIDWDQNYVAEAGSVIKFNGADVADVTGSGGFIEVSPRNGSGLSENDGLLLASGYFDGFTLNAQLISLLRTVLANGGLTLPTF